MEITPLTTVKVYNFSVNDAHAIIQETVDFAKEVNESFDALTQASFADMVKTNNAMGDRMNLATKSTETSEVVKEDIVRDSWWSEIRNDVKSASRSPDDSRKAAGEALMIFFAPYWKLDKEPLGTETDTIVKMLEKFDASATLPAHAATISITAKLVKLKDSNTRIAALCSSRTVNKAANAGPSATSLKAIASVSYNQFCSLVELANVLTPGDAIKTLFNNMDQVRKKYAVLYKASGNDDDTTDTGTDTNQA